MSARIEAARVHHLSLRAVAAWPLAARAQQSAMPVIGYLNSRSRETDTPFLAAFHRGLNETGYVEGRTWQSSIAGQTANMTDCGCWQPILVDRRVTVMAATSTPAALAAKAATPAIPIVFTTAADPIGSADLVRNQVAVLVAVGGELSALAAKAATSSIPIVFSVGGDPVKSGLVASFNHPGGNMTGLTYLTESLEAKRIGLLRELVPGAQALAVMVDPNIPGSRAQAKEAQEAMANIGVRPLVMAVNSERDFDPAFASIGNRSAAG